MQASPEQNDGEWYEAFPHNGGVYDLIRTALYSGSTPGRVQAITSLGKSGDPRAVRPLVDLLGDPAGEIRLASTRALGALKSGRPVDELIALLRDEDELGTVRREAAAALIAIRSTGALRGLREYAADESVDQTLRTFTSELLRDISAL